MLKLMKYEFRKTQATKLMLLAITAIAEIAYLIGLYTEHETTMAIGMIALVFLAFLGIFLVGVESIATLHRDMNTRQSYMLFMTPNSSYKILGAKVLECGLSILLAGAFFFALGVLDISLLFGKVASLQQMWNAIQDFLSNITINGHALEINIRVMASLAFLLLSSWILTINMAYLAVVISAALLNGKRFNGFISFVLFLLLDFGAARLIHLVTQQIHGDIATMLVYGCCALVLSAIMYFITAQIMERKLSV